MGLDQEQLLGLRNVGLPAPLRLLQLRLVVVVAAGRVLHRFLLLLGGGAVFPLLSKIPDTADDEYPHQYACQYLPHKKAFSTVA